MDLIVLDDDNSNNGVSKKVDKLYVAVGKDVEENESLLLWAIQNSGGRVISIIHVHQPDEYIPILGKKYHRSTLGEEQVRPYRRIERQFMLKTLDEYLHICQKYEVEAEKLYIEMDSIENGMLQLIAQHNIEKLVMGAASDNNYHVKMAELKSKKAVYLQLHAPISCHIWFICKGHLIHQRNLGSQMRVNVESEASTNSRTTREFEGAFHSEVATRTIDEFFFVDNTEVAPVSRTQLESTVCPDWVKALGSEPQGSNVSTGSSSHAKSPESLYMEELRKRKRLEEELEKVKSERNRLREELQLALDHILVLESKVANYDMVLKELQEGVVSNVELLQICEKERDDLKMERDNVLQTAEELLNQSAEAASRTSAPKFFMTLSDDEIKNATNDFDPALQIWEGDNGSIYRGVISHSQVTIRIWHPECLQGQHEFNQEVEILSKFRHPNLVTLIGVCPEVCALVYEHLPNGSLKDRLCCKDNTPPLSWKTRIRIATDLCCALIFLHSRSPQRVVHGSLKPASLFLDSNFTCKIGDFGYSHLIPHEESSLLTELLNGSEYTAPEVFETGEANPSVDVYSFGIILLELLTGKPASDFNSEWGDDMDDDDLRSLLDASAGEWPFVQAGQLAQLASRCCDENASNRPNLETEIWRVLEPMRASSGGSTSYILGDDEHRQAPPYFICPIFQEVMKDPHVAADGYTYEAEALRGWLDSGHDTSPMTNLQLEQLNLVPNHALRSAIQEWQQQQ